MRILVTGATSLIGREVISLLLENGHQVRSLTRQHNTPPLLKKTDIWTYDLHDVPKGIAESIDAVIHIAAATPGANSSAESYQQTNIEGTGRLLSVCEEQKVRRFIFISSIVVLFDYADPYTRSKKEAEAMISQSDLNWTILRPAEIIGADKSWENFLQILRKKKIVMVPGNGRQLRHPVFYRDVAKAIIQVLNNSNSFQKKYTLAAAAPVSYYRYLALVKKYFKFRFILTIFPAWILKPISVFKIFLPARFKRKLVSAFNMLRSSSLDIENAVHDFSYTPVDVEKAIQETAKELQD